MGDVIERKGNAPTRLIFGPSYIDIFRKLTLGAPVHRCPASEKLLYIKNLKFYFKSI